MKSVKIAELRDHLSALPRSVERGAVVEVTDCGRPIARIVPMLASTSRLSLVPPSRPFDAIRDRLRAAAGWGIDSTRLLLEERKERGA